MVRWGRGILQDGHYLSIDDEWRYRKTWGGGGGGAVKMSCGIIRGWYTAMGVGGGEGEILTGINLPYK